MRQETQSPSPLLLGGMIDQNSGRLGRLQMVSHPERKMATWPPTIASQRLREHPLEIFPLLGSQSLQFEYCGAGTMSSSWLLL
jgi:hypothetical protein